MHIRSMTQADFQAFWPVFSEIIQAQETYAFDPGMTIHRAYELWCELPLNTYVVEEQGDILGSYYIKANGMGPGSHVCNCGYMVNPMARGQGLARLMCEHSQQVALEAGFRAMQFNSVVSTNKIAVELWKTLGFDIIGTIPQGYKHKHLGYVDCFIMYKSLC